MEEFNFIRKEELFFQNVFAGMHLPLVIKGENYKGAFFIRYPQKYTICDIDVTDHFNEHIYVSIIQRIETLDPKVHQFKCKVSSEGIIDVHNFEMEAGTSIIVLTLTKTDVLPSLIVRQLKKSAVSKDYFYHSKVADLLDEVSTEPIDFQLTYTGVIFDNKSSTCSGIITYEDLLRIIHVEIRYKEEPKVVPVTLFGITKMTHLQSSGLRNTHEGTIVFLDDIDEEDTFAYRLRCREMIFHNISRSMLLCLWDPENKAIAKRREKSTKASLSRYAKTAEYISHSSQVTTSSSRLSSGSHSALSLDQANPYIKTRSLIDKVSLSFTRQMHEFSLDPSQAKILKEAFGILPPDQAERIDLYWNKGYSPHKCADICGVGPSAILSSIKSGFRSIQIYCKIAKDRNDCMDEDDPTNFDWYTFFERRSDIFTKAEKSVLGSILNDTGEIETIGDLRKKASPLRFRNEMNTSVEYYYALHGMTKIMRNIKRRAEFLFIDVRSLDSLHHLFADVKEFDHIQPDDRPSYFKLTILRYYLQTHPEERKSLCSFT